MKEKYKNVGHIKWRIIEEAGEVLQAIAKAERFGYGNYHPDRPDSNNRQEILNELKDLRAVCDEGIESLTKGDKT